MTDGPPAPGGGAPDEPQGLGSDPPEGGELTIQQASRLLGVPAPTLRSWERRYQIPEVRRSHGGHRRYSLDQVGRLRRMRDAIARGQPAAEAAAAVAGEAVGPARPLIDAFLQAAYGLRAAEVSGALDAARQALGLGGCLDDVLFPAMQQIGRDWRIGRCDVPHEQVATDASRQWLARVQPSPGVARRRGTVLLACGPLDPHTLGLESISALLQERGWDCRLLGGCIPTATLRTALTELDPAAVVLVSHLSVARRSAIGSLRSAKVSGAALFYAGNAFLTRQARHGVPGHYLGENLTRAADLVTSVLTGPAPAGG